MRIESLNIWGGRLREPLLEHISTQAQTIDIFCLQEVYSGKPSPNGSVVLDIHNQIDAVLPNHTGYYEPAYGAEGLAMFVRNDVNVTGGGSTLVHRWNVGPGRAIDQDRVLQFLEVELGVGKITVANLHGLHLGANKGDTAERLVQFQTAKAEVVKGPTVLCGDFNVRPGTASLKVFEDDPDPEKCMVNLVTSNRVPTTRTPFYRWSADEPYADYILVSPQPLINVVDFQVLSDAVSDHYPLVVVIK